ncbi:testisin-like [Centruroides vittatus]|uniref:testisin-like n=1 Tax=Centruroides vittatus TaxID=120091 RepID=UPI00350EC555
MMKFKKAVVFNDYIRPVCLPTTGMNFVGEYCKASGWGRVESNAKLANTLQVVHIKVFGWTICRSAYSSTYRISVSNKHVCAGTLQGGKGTCKGDSGGPLTCVKNHRHYLIGLTSFGSNCAKPNFPDVYTNVAVYLNWIRSIMSGNP